jgi:hypothetical protein
MTAWVLVIFLTTGNRPMLSAVEFSSEKTCLEGQLLLQRKLFEAWGGRPPYYFSQCVPK